jgi:hypothetical protein
VNSEDQATPDANQKETSSDEGMEEEKTGEEKEQAATDDNEEAASREEQVVTGESKPVEAAALQTPLGHRGRRERNVPDVYNPAVTILKAIQPFWKP